MTKKHYLVMIGAIALGAILRFCNLDLKPLWLDEVITALFSMGRNYNDLPLDVVFPVEQLQQLFTLKPGVSCSQIAQNLATQSTHPPLFFCLIHGWFSWLNPVAPGWIWTLRSLPALFGVGAIAAIYYLNRVAFSPESGLIAAALMAVSPFAVYLSQEARHYTLPLILITLALLGLIQIQKDIFVEQQVRPSVWLGWALINSVGLYVHYFFILALIAQLGTLFGLMYCGFGILPANPFKRNSIFIASLAVIAVVASFTPWLPMMLAHFNRSETNWLPPAYHIAPIYQTLFSWVVMFIALPVENQPLWIAISAGLLMGVFAIWVVWKIFTGIKQMWRTPANHLATLSLLSFTIWVLVEFLAIAYLLGKDITFVPRYHFVYYPSLCALVAASLVQRKKEYRRRGKSEVGSRKSEVAQRVHARVAQRLAGRFSPSRKSFNAKRGDSAQVGIFNSSTSPTPPTSPCPLVPLSPCPLVPPTPLVPLSPCPLRLSPLASCLLMVGILSCIFVTSNLAFQKPFNPQQVAQNMNLEPSVPLMVISGYQDYQDVALGLSFALALKKIRSESIVTEVGFFKRSPGYEPIWQKLSQLPPLVTPNLNLWVVAPGLRQRDYPPQLAISSQNTCLLDSMQHHRIGIPYQLYRCGR